MRAYVEAYGCTLNFGESREIEDLLTSRGWEIVHSHDECDLAVLATCVVIETTERAMLKRIKALSGVPRLVITGCMATACRDKVERVAPHASIMAPGDLGGLSEMIGGSGCLPPCEPVKRSSYGIVPIASGCLGSCAYCITRLARGQLRSRPVDAVLGAVMRASEAGPREIRLTAQDTAAYGAEIGTDLPSLVSSICALDGDFRLRIGMMNPRSALPMADRIAEMYLEPKVFKFLHLPVQSASDGLLQDMDRGYTVDQFLSIVRKVRERVPEITLSTDLIVGYPGESEEDHRRNLSMISEIRPDIVNVTRFSARPGTKAALADGRIVGWKAKERSREITGLRFRVALEKNERWIGRTVKALSTEPGKNGSTILRTIEYKQIVVGKQVPLGRYFEVEVTDATPTYLVGRLGGVP